MLDRFERFLETIPPPANVPVFARVAVRAINAAETPVLETDLRGVVMSAADVIAMAREHIQLDTAIEVEANWDLWQRDFEQGLWQRMPQTLLITCHGAEYEDAAAAAEFGDFFTDLGLEHLYTGHGGVLGSHGARSVPSDPVEAEFLASMLHEEHLHEYYEKTRDNIQQLLRWVRAVEQALPIERYNLSSEGEENFEARMDEILAVR
jgi:hypothetical protein